MKKEIWVKNNKTQTFSLNKQHHSLEPNGVAGGTFNPKSTKNNLPLMELKLVDGRQVTVCFPQEVADYHSDATEIGKADVQLTQIGPTERTTYITNVEKRKILALALHWLKNTEHKRHATALKNALQEHEEHD